MAGAPFPNGRRVSTFFLPVERTACARRKITLDASGSSDPDGAYGWQSESLIGRDTMPCATMVAPIAEKRWCC
jgi:hypothetical protein